jgi:hypothetical protein
LLGKGVPIGQAAWTLRQARMKAMAIMRRSVTYFVERPASLTNENQY